MQSTGIFSGRSAVSALALAGIVLSASANPAAVRAQSRTRAAQAGAVDTEARPTDLFEDFLHYALLGKFTLADKFAEALLNHPNVDPVALLDVADSNPTSIETLTILVKHEVIGPKASQIMQLLALGERETRKKPERIRENIRKLGGSPQQKYVAMQNLAESGEYAVPALVAVLSDPDRRDLHLPVRDALVQIGKPAVGPLSIALSTDDNYVRDTVIQILGKLGYEHAVPYLRDITVDGNIPQESRAAATAAIDSIAQIRGRPTLGSADELFFSLAERYYNEDDSVRADPRINDANVWYWDGDSETLIAKVVPTKIFGPVMSMRCCQRAMAVRHDNGDAISLWLTANIRRESRLGMNIESRDPNRTGEVDVTRPDNFPPALSFTQAAGPTYAHRVLERAVKDRDSAVALGAIEALRVTAGEASLIGSTGSRLPLVQALHFPDLVVRTRASLALGAALPRTPFAESQYVIPLLANALSLSGHEAILVVDPDESNLNRIVDSMRTGDRIVIGAKNFYTGLGRVRAELQSVTGVFVSADVAAPGLGIGLQQLRSEASFAKTPVVVMATASNSVAAEQAADSDNYVESASSSSSGADLLAALARVRTRTGQSALDGDLAERMALQAADTLYTIARDGRTVYDLAQAESSLIGAMENGSPKLQVSAGMVVAMLPTSTAQVALAQVGLDGGRDDSLRIAMLHATAISAKNFGNMLTDKLVNDLVQSARSESNLEIRTAASEALGALNLSTEPASEIIRSFNPN
ncbi:MAG: HEAT repeat domain-containing protein [Planctomycetota bacterium]|jgi:HEAT repeat protein